MSKDNTKEPKDVKGIPKQNLEEQTTIPIKATLGNIEEDNNTSKEELLSAAKELAENLKKMIENPKIESKNASLQTQHEKEIDTQDLSPKTNSDKELPEGITQGSVKTKIARFEKEIAERTSSPKQPTTEQQEKEIGKQDLSPKTNSDKELPEGITQGSVKTKIARFEKEIAERTSSPKQPTTEQQATAKQMVMPESPLAQDSIIFGGKEESIGPKTLASTGLASEFSEVDPITEAVRKEILERQQELLKKEIAASDPSVTTMTPEKFREYLVSEKGKEEAAKIFAKPEMQTVLNKIEVDGYKKVHNKFQENFQNVAWSPEASAPNQPKTKSCDITNDAGEVVASIKETTHDKAPISVTLDNGNSVQVNSYRTIEFPVDNKGKGPLHLSMAVKDENGKNIAEKDAVYFTAHYDDKGRLTEVSSPVPVKFMGKGDDAVGYIERNGKVYTLPVTQGNYKAMMQEVAKTKGMGVDLSREVEKPAQDLVMTKEKTVEPVLEKEKEKEAPAPKPIEPEKVEPSPKAQEKSGDSIIKEQEPTPLKIVLKPGLTGAEKTEQIDNALKNVSPEQIVATLKDQIAKGGSEVVGLIVEATKETSDKSHPNVSKLTADQFKEVYDHGMKSAKAIVDTPQVGINQVRQRTTLENIQSACGKLTDVAKVSAAEHTKNARTNTVNFADKKQHGAAR